MANAILIVCNKIIARNCFVVAAIIAAPPSLPAEQNGGGIFLSKAKRLHRVPVHPFVGGNNMSMIYNRPVFLDVRLPSGAAADGLHLVGATVVGPANENPPEDGTAELNVAMIANADALAELTVDGWATGGRVQATLVGADKSSHFCVPLHPQRLRMLPCQCFAAVALG
jgi:hypothetical protein